MPQIPLIQSEESVRVGGIDSYANPRQFGAGIGRELQQAAGAIRQAAGAVQEMDAASRARDDALALANADAQISPQLTNIALTAKNEAPPDGSGVAERIAKEQRDLIDKTADDAFSKPGQDKLRMRFKTQGYHRVADYASDGVAFEFGKRNENNLQQANQSIDALVNNVRADITQYDVSAQSGEALIDAFPGIPAAQKIKMKADLRSDLAVARFDAGITAANSSDDFEALTADLAQDKWKQDMDPAAYARAQDAIRITHNQFITGERAETRAMVTSIDERSKKGVLVPPAEMKELDAKVRSSRDPGITRDYARLVNQQEILRKAGKAPPLQLRREAERVRQGAISGGGDVGAWANRASQLTGGEIKASYLVNKLSREYSPKDIAAGKFNEYNKAGTSQARGLFQVIPSTWIMLMRKHGVAVGVNTAGMSDAQLLEMRGDPQMSTNMAALYALDNKKYLAVNGAATGDTELYIAHFLGPAGAVSFLRALQAGPNNSVVPTGNFGAKAINANLPIFTGKRGQRLSFLQVYNNIAGSFQDGQTSAQFESATYIDDIAGRKEQEIKDDPVSVYQRDKGMGQRTLQTPEDFMLAGQTAQGAADYYSIPTTDIKPFTAEEAQTVGKQLREGSADETLNIMAQIQAMDQGSRGMAQAAYKQLGEENTALGYAAALAAQGDAATAGSVVRGTKMLKEDKSSAALFGGQNEAPEAFYETMAGALSEVDPSQRNAVFEASKAHYAYTFGRNGGGQFDKTNFETSVKAVLGGHVGEVNGRPTLLPKGLDEETFDDAIDNMTTQQLVELSVDKLPPLDAEGGTVPMEDISNEGEFVAIGNNTYKIRMTDGRFLSTGRPDPQAPYNMRAFMFVADVDALSKIARAQIDPYERGDDKRAYDPEDLQDPRNPFSPNYDPSLWPE